MNRAEQLQSPEIDAAGRIEALARELGQAYLELHAGFAERRTRACGLGGADAILDIAPHASPEQINLLVAGALAAAGLGPVLECAAGDITRVPKVPNIAAVVTHRIRVIGNHRVRQTRPADADPTDWLPQGARHDSAGRSMRASNRVNNRLSDHVDDDQQQHIARVQSGIPGRSMRAPKDAA